MMSHLTILLPSSTPKDFDCKGHHLQFEGGLNSSVKASCDTAVGDRAVCDRAVYMQLSVMELSVMEL